MGRPPQMPALCQRGPSRLEMERGDLIGPVPYLKEEEVCRHDSSSTREGPEAAALRHREDQHKTG